MFSRCLNGFASPMGSSRFRLANSQGRTTQPLRSRPITGPSTLLRAAPPLRPASVLSSSRLEPLAACPFTSLDVTKHRFSRSIRKPGRASRRLHAGCRSGSIRASPELIPEEGSPPGSRFWHRLIRFRHFCSGSLALASLDRACRNLVPAFPQRSPPRLLPAAACGGLRSAPDHRTRRALLHLLYSCAPQTTHAALVTHDPKLTCSEQDAIAQPRKRRERQRRSSSGEQNLKLKADRPVCGEVRVVDIVYVLQQAFIE